MPSSFFGFSIATSGMNAYNTALSTTAHNIANIKTTGYSKQNAVQQARDAISLKTKYGMVGAGTQILDIESSRDVYYDYKYRASNSVFGKYSTLSYYMANLENYLYVADKDTGSLNKSLNSFFNSLSSLTTDVSDPTIRAEVTGYADTMATFVNELATNLQQTQQEINSEIKNGVDRINAYAEQIASVTKQINTLEVYGSTANDLRDQRATLLDELSQWVNINVTEQAPADGQGMGQFIVSIAGGGILVDTYVYNQLNVINSTTKDNQNDVDGLYTLQWSNGQNFNIHSSIMGGNLQALFELRDGNNGNNFSSTITEYEKSNADFGGKSTITLVTDANSSEGASNLSKLNIPESGGVLTIANSKYEYESFTVSVAPDGTYTYNFVLKNTLLDGNVDHLQSALNAGNTEAKIGDDIAYRGIPYYMAQINEFVRVLSANFNQVQNKGYDLNGNLGQDLFIATGNTTGEEFDMTEFLYNQKDDYYYLNGFKVVNTVKEAELTAAGYTFKAVTGEANHFYLKDAKGNLGEKVFMPPDSTSVFTFDSLTSSGQPTSYYSITAMNFRASSELVNDGTLLACASKNTTTESGPSEGNNLAGMLALQSDPTMFKQGDPESFLSVMTATIGVDAMKAKDSMENSENILDAVEHRRLSKSGVDEDEEGQNLIIFRALLNYQYQVISVMNEVLDKLINGTGV